MMAAALDAQLHHPHLFNLPPPQPLNRVITCDRHPGQQVTGFCASCLRERLTTLEPATRRLRSSSTSSGASAALRSLFFRPTAHGHTHHNAVTAASSSSSLSSSILPGLRRCKSFSLGCGAPPAAVFEPQRRSCDVRGRSTLGTLFHLDDPGPYTNSACPFNLPLYSSGAAPAPVGEGEIEVESQGRGRLSNVAAPVPEYREEEEDADGEDGRLNREVNAGVQAAEVGEDDDGSRGVSLQWAEEAHEEVDEEEMRKQGQVRPMKDHIDLDAHSKKPPPKDLKEIAGSFWLAASVFSKKLQKWRRKQKEKKHRHETMGAGKTPAIAPVTARPCSRSRRFSRDAQSEVADYTFGRRSCDTEPRFSLDAGRVSFDDPRFSWDEPRASWDGYLTGVGRSVLPRLPPMLSVLEDAPVVQRSDGQIPVEEDAVATPGGSLQTRDYYLDSSSQRRRRSLDRSSSRRSSVDAASAAELLKPVSDARLSTDAKLSPTAMADEYLHHVSKFERDYNSSSLSALHDDCWESLEKAGGGGSTPRKPRVWSKAWSLWGLIHRRRSRGGGGRMVERSLSETWQVLPGEGHPRKFFRSNSSVGCRHSFRSGSSSTNGCALGITRKNGLEMNGHGKKRREEFVLERCQSSRRFSPTHVGDGGLPRFYVTPVPSSGLPKGRCKSSHAPPRSVLRLY